MKSRTTFPGTTRSIPLNDETREFVEQVKLLLADAARVEQQRIARRLRERAKELSDLPGTVEDGLVAVAGMIESGSL